MEFGRAWWLKQNIMEYKYKITKIDTSDRFSGYSDHIIEADSLEIRNDLGLLWGNNGIVATFDLTKYTIEREIPEPVQPPKTSKQRIEELEVSKKYWVDKFNDLSSEHRRFNKDLKIMSIWSFKRFRKTL